MEVFAQGCVENTVYKIKPLKYSFAANEDKVFPV